MTTTPLLTAKAKIICLLSLAGLLSANAVASVVSPQYLPLPVPVIDAMDGPDLMNNLYAPHAPWGEWFRFEENRIRVRLDEENWYEVSMEGEDQAPRYWRSWKELPVASDINKPLEGLHLALDPGHIGGEWAKIEERWFQMEGGKPVAEGDMVLKVARMLEKELKSLGAKVTLIRKGSEPVTRERPRDLRDEAARQLGLNLEEDLSDEQKHALRKQAERLFYRTREIEARGRLVNEKIRPDAVIALHFNGAPWPDGDMTRLSTARNMHLLVFGAVMEGEITSLDQRMALLHKLLAGAHEEELQLAEALKQAMIEEMGYPNYAYRGKNAIGQDEEGLIWGRNLLANRLFRCPVVYMEPYIMNGEFDYLRIQEGDYEGYRMVGGEYRKSIYREYRDTVVKGILAHYGRERSVSD